VAYELEDMCVLVVVVGVMLRGENDYGCKCEANVDRVMYDAAPRA